MYASYQCVIHTIEITTLGHIPDFSKFSMLVCNGLTIPHITFSDLIKSVIGNYTLCTDTGTIKHNCAMLAIIFECD